MWFSHKLTCTCVCVCDTPNTCYYPYAIWYLEVVKVV